MTYSEVVAHEPRISAVMAGARPVPPGRNPWPEYSRLKSELCCFVGWRAAVPEVRNSYAYEAAITRLSSTLGI